MGVVQGERDVARQHRIATGERLLEPAEPGPEGPVEPGLLPGHHVDHQVVLGP